jgi:hypothetical protein
VILEMSGELLPTWISLHNVAVKYETDAIKLDGIMGRVVEEPKIEQWVGSVGDAKGSATLRAVTSYELLKEDALDRMAS